MTKMTYSNTTSEWGRNFERGMVVGAKWAITKVSLATTIDTVYRE